MRYLSLILIGAMVLFSSVHPAPKRMQCPTTLTLQLYNNGKVVFEDNDWGKKGSSVIRTNYNVDGKPIVSSSLPLVEVLEQYIGVLVDELNEVVGMAATHGWKSSRVEIGEQLRNRIAELKRK